jgi:uncharacterized protein with von Willebrand factor type A (vWA) domain
MTDFEAQFKEINRKLAKLETHLINLIIPIQGIHQIFTNPQYMTEFVKEVHNYLNVGIVELSKRIDKLNKGLGDYYQGLESIKELDVVTAIGEIKYLGSKLNDIERRLYKFEKNGIDRNLQLDITLDGVEVLKDEKLPKKKLLKKIKARK